MNVKEICSMNEIWREHAYMIYAFSEFPPFSETPLPPPKEADLACSLADIRRAHRRGTAKMAAKISVKCENCMEKNLERTETEEGHAYVCPRFKR